MADGDRGVIAPSIGRAENHAGDFADGAAGETVQRRGQRQPVDRRFQLAAGGIVSRGVVTTFHRELFVDPIRICICVPVNGAARQPGGQCLLSVVGHYMKVRRDLSARILLWLVLTGGCGGGGSSSRRSDHDDAVPSRHGRTLRRRVPGRGRDDWRDPHRPDISGTAPAIVVLHGWLTAGSNGAMVVEPRARRYSEEGYVALAMSMRGWPPSAGADDCGLRQPDDVIEAVTWLGRQPGVRPARIGIVGFSQGGQVTLSAAARGARVRAVVAYYPVTDVALWKTTTANTDIPATSPASASRAGPRRDRPDRTPPRLACPYCSSRWQ